MRFAEHEVVVLAHDLAQHNLRAGDVGTVVHVYAEGKAYEVEFANGAGETLALATLEPTDIRPSGPEKSSFTVSHSHRRCETN